MLMAVLVGSIALAFLESTGRVFDSAPEPIWMTVWGLGLLLLSFRAKSVLRRRMEASSVSFRQNSDLAIDAAGGWRSALAAKLVADRAQLSN